MHGEKISDWYETMGARIRNRRKELYLTQEETAKKIGRSLSFYGHVERGSRKLSVDTLAGICQALDISATYVLFGRADVEIQERLSCPLTQEQINGLHEAVENWVAAL